MDLDERRQPKFTPKLPNWALPKRQSVKPEPQKNHRTNGAGNLSNAIALQAHISEVAEHVGYGLSRSVLMGIANIDEPGQVPPALLAVVATKLDDTLRGVERLRAATAVVGQQRYTQLCPDLNFPSDALDDIPNREALRKAVVSCSDSLWGLVPLLWIAHCVWLVAVAPGCAETQNSLTLRLPA